MEMQDIISTLKEAGFEDKLEQLTPLIKTAVRVVPTAVEDEDEIPVGASKLGGRPDLPVGGQWPVVDGVLLEFVGQFRMEEVAPLDETGLLPKEGLLSFFFDGSLTGYLEGDFRDRCKVIYYAGPIEDLRRVGAPQRAPDNMFRMFSPCQVTFEQIATLPPSAELQGDLIPAVTPLPFDSREQLLDYQLLRGDVWDSGTQFLGHVVEVQGEEEKFDAIRKKYPERYVYEDYHYTHEDELQRRMQNLVLLFTATSAEEADMSWGDAGVVYYWIDKADLLAGNWDAVWASMTCG